jgi:methylenetetrahydrofolate dehydrogenase (NADP+)/methenyltetrahydrofolate cyclohydrolase
VKAGAEALTAAGGRPPGLAAVLVGEDPASRLYVASKARASRDAGFVGRTVELPASASRAELLREIDGLNRDDGIDGIIVQLPLPAHLSAEEAIAAIDPAKDADGLHPENVGRLWLDLEGAVPATPSGIVALLRRERIPLAGRRAVVVGRSRLVGKPLAALLLREHCTVTICHSRTAELAEVCRQGELLVAAAGRPALIGPEHVADGAVVVDVGVHRITDPATVERLYPGDEGRRATWEQKGYVVTGDVDFVRVAPRAGAITPVPGGVGPLTVTMLLVNALAASRRRQHLPPG